MHGENRNIYIYIYIYMVFMGKPEGKRQLGRLRSRRMDNIKMNLRELGWSGMD
jgi:hypothetical protein